jgi:predicted nucleic acid-binding protein
VKGVTLDSWAVLAWLQGEPAGALVADLVAWCEGDEKAGRAISRFVKAEEPPRLFLNVVNLGEIFYITGRRKGRQEAAEVVRRLKLGPLVIVGASERLVLAAAEVKIAHRVAYADAFAVATARMTRSALMTGDPEVRELPGLDLIWIAAG